jgi:hypothetical protein
VSHQNGRLNEPVGECWSSGFSRREKSKPRAPAPPEGGTPAAIWSEIVDDDFELPPDQPLTLVAYSAGDLKRAYIEPVAPGASLPDMTLFLEPDRYVPVPLEQTYQSAFDAVPRRWQGELGP